MPDTPVGSNSPDYGPLAAADLGATIYCKVTATNASGSANANSNTVGPVTAAAGSSSTWSPSDHTPETAGESVITFSNGNRTVSAGFIASFTHYLKWRGTLSHNSGKRYFEVKMDLQPYEGHVGLAAAAEPLSDAEQFPGVHNSHGFVCTMGTNAASILAIVYNTGAGTYNITPNPTTAVNGVLGFAIDFDTRTAYIRYNSTWLGEGTPADPVAGTGGLAWGAMPTALFPYCEITAGGINPEGTFTIATQDAHFLNAPPTGFTAWG
jgi:hypothetical protein